MQMTKHARFERSERLLFIVDTVGIGEPLYIAPAKGGGERVLTSTGVIIIKHGNSIITAYIAQFNQAYSLFKAVNPNSIFPNKLERRIKYNEKNLVPRQPKEEDKNEL